MVKPKETKDSSSNGYVGKPIAPFKALTTTGKDLSSTNHGAKVLIISLWGLNCASCLDEMKVLDPVYKEFHDRGLKIWAVNTEDITAQEIEKGLRMREFELSYDLVPDPGLKITKLFTSWFIPVTLIVDSEGIVQYYKVGFNEADAEKIKAKVGALLAR
jgi:peroxiredoxin